MTSQSQPSADKYVFLAGRPPASEYGAFVRTMAVNGHNLSQFELAKDWRNANARMLELGKTEAGIADKRVLKRIPKELQPIVKEMASKSYFDAAFSMVKTSFAVVELDTMVVYQKFINLGHVDSILKALPHRLTSIEIAKLAFGIDRPMPPVTVRQAGNGVYQIVSPSSDLRTLEASLLEPTQILNDKRTGIPSIYVTLPVGFGVNCLSALYVEGRLILNNGSHRAFALRSRGVTHVPCVISHISNRDELELIAPVEVCQHPDRYLKVPRPSLLRDYFDERLIRTFPVARKNRMVQVKISASVIDVPAA